MLSQKVAQKHLSTLDSVKTCATFSCVEMTRLKGRMNTLKKQKLLFFQRVHSPLKARHFDAAEGSTSFDAV